MEYITITRNNLENLIIRCIKRVLMNENLSDIQLMDVILNWNWAELKELIEQEIKNE